MEESAVHTRDFLLPLSCTFFLSHRQHVLHHDSSLVSLIFTVAPVLKTFLTSLDFLFLCIRGFHALDEFRKSRTLFPISNEFEFLCLTVAKTQDLMSLCIVPNDFATVFIYHHGAYLLKAMVTVITFVCCIVYHDTVACCK